MNIDFVKYSDPWPSYRRYGCMDRETGHEVGWIEESYFGILRLMARSPEGGPGVYVLAHEWAPHSDLEDAKRHARAYFAERNSDMTLISKRGYAKMPDLIPMNVEEETVEQIGVSISATLTIDRTANAVQVVVRASSMDALEAVLVGLVGDMGHILAQNEGEVGN